MTDIIKCFEHRLWNGFSQYMISSGMWLPHWRWIDAYDGKLKDYWWASYWETYLAGAKYLIKDDDA